MIEDLLEKISALKFISFDEYKKNQLEKYYKLIIDENEMHNLTRITDYREVWAKHFYDSLIICDIFDFNEKRICDIGTGMGIPGIVLKICVPSIKLTLVESNTKKTNFLERVIRELKLNNVRVVSDRAEKYSKTFKETQDFIISRAMAALNILLEVGVQALKVDGYFIGLKSRKLDEEIRDLNGQEKVIGLKFERIQEIDEEELGVRRNIVYKKIAKTSPTYPRMYSQIKNRPLGK